MGVAVRSECLGNATELAGSAEEVDGEALGVGVDATDNLDPPLWWPDDDDGVCDLTGEYCCSNPTPPRGDLSFVLLDDGGLGGSPPPIPTWSLVFGESSIWKWTECGEEEEPIPSLQISSSSASEN